MRILLQVPCIFMRIEYWWVKRLGLEIFFWSAFFQTNVSSQEWLKYFIGIVIVIEVRFCHNQILICFLTWCGVMFWPTTSPWYYLIQGTFYVRKELHATLKWHDDCCKSCIHMIVWLFTWYCSIIYSKNVSRLCQWNTMIIWSEKNLWKRFMKYDTCNFFRSKNFHLWFAITFNDTLHFH